MFPLLLIGGALGVGFVVVSVTYAVVKSVAGLVKNRKANKNSSESKNNTTKPKTKSEEKNAKIVKNNEKEEFVKISKKEALKRLNDYRNYINSGSNNEGKTVDQIIEDKIKTSNIQPNTKKAEELVSKTLKNSWSNIVTNVNKKVDDLIKEVDSSENYEDIVSKIPPFDYKWFDSKGCDNLISKTIKKYAMYYGNEQNIQKYLDKYKEYNDSYIGSELYYISQIAENIEGKVASAEISENLFQIELNRGISDINASLDRIRARVKDKQFILELEKRVSDNSDYLKNLSDNELDNLKNMIKDSVKNNKVNSTQIENLWKSLASEMSARSRGDAEIKSDMKKIVLVLRNDIAKKKDIKVISDKIDSLDESLKNLTTKELVELNKLIEGLKKDYNQVEDKFEKIVDKKIANLENRVREFAKKSIAVRIGQKMKEFEEKTLKKISEEVYNKLNASEELTEEEMNNIIDKVIESIQITRK